MFFSQVEQEVESGERGWDADSCSSVRKKILKSVQDGCLKYDSGLLKQVHRLYIVFRTFFQNNKNGILEN